MMAILHAALLAKTEDESGYPNMDFEAFYQQGIACFSWGLSKPLVRHAFKHLCTQWNVVAMWQIRAFVYGRKGLCDSGRRERLVADDYQWPLPPDSSWKMVVCVYPDGACDLDFVHPVSRMFWSEDNGFLTLPTYDRYKMGRWWFEEMGFEIMLMQPSMTVQVAEPTPHLKLV